jgi:hypothetical protein
MGQFSAAVLIRGWLPQIRFDIFQLYKFDEPGFENMVKLSTLRYETEQSGDRARFDQVRQGLTAADESRQGIAVAEAFVWFVNFLQLTRDSKSFDKRDKIYANLGIADLRHPGCITSYIQPDYGISPQSLFLKVMTLILEHSNDLDWISIVGPITAARDMQGPSWVPEFDKRFSYLPFGPLKALDQAAEKPWLTSQSYTCGKFQCGPKYLRCFADYIGKILTIEDMSSGPDPRNLASIIPMFRMALRLPLLVHGRPRFEVFWRTMVADIEIVTENTQSLDHQTFGTSFRAFLVMLVWAIFNGMNTEKELRDITLATLIDLWRQLDPQTKSSDEDHCTSDDAVQWLQILRDREEFGFPQDKEKGDRCTERAPYMYRQAQRFTKLLPNSAGRFLVLLSCGRLGLALAGVQEGDQVWTLQNSSAPFVLRPGTTNGEYSLVGDCFILDMMREKLWDADWASIARRGQRITIV